MRFSPVKKRRKNKSEGKSNNANSDGRTVSLSSSTTTGTITPTENRIAVVSTTKQCIVCSSTKTSGPWGKVEGTISHWIKVINDDEKFVLKAKNADHIHMRGRDKCHGKLRKRVREVIKCIVCETNFGNESQLLIVSTDDLTKLNQWLNQKQIDSMKYKHELHKKCMERVKKDVDANSDEPQLMNDENDENSEFDPNLMLEKLMEEKLLEHMKGEVPAHVPSVIETVRDAFHEYVEGLNYVNDTSKQSETR